MGLPPRAVISPHTKYVRPPRVTAIEAPPEWAGTPKQLRLTVSASGTTSTPFSQRGCVTSSCS